MSASDFNGYFIEIGEQNLILARTNLGQRPRTVEDIREVWLGDAPSVDAAIKELKSDDGKAIALLRVKSHATYGADQGQAQKYNSASAIEDFLKENFPAENLPASWAWCSQKDGRAPEGNTLWLLDAAAKQNTDDAVEKIRGWSFEIARCQSAVLTLAGALTSAVKIAQLNTPLVLCDVTELRTHLIVISGQGVSGFTAIPAGFDALAEATQAALGLKFRGSAARLLFNESYDFADASSKITEALGAAIRNALPSLGGAAPTHVLFSGILARQGWISQSLATAAGLKLFNVDVNAWAGANGIGLGGKITPSAVSPSWLGVLAAAVGIDPKNPSTSSPWNPLFSGTPLLSAPIIATPEPKPAVIITPPTKPVETPKPAEVPAAKPATPPPAIIKPEAAPAPKSAVVITPPAKPAEPAKSAVVITPPAKPAEPAKSAVVITPPKAAEPAKPATPTPPTPVKPAAVQPTPAPKPGDQKAAAKQPEAKPAPAKPAPAPVVKPGPKPAEPAKPAAPAPAAAAPAKPTPAPVTSSTRPPTAAPFPKKKGSPMPIIIGVVVLLLAGGGFFVYNNNQKAAQEEARRKTEEAEAKLAAEKRARDEEAKRLRDEAEAAKRKADEDAKRLAEEAANARTKADQERIATMERMLNARGSLTVNTEPSGATVAVGELAPRPSPVELKDLRLGSYDITITLAGYETEKRKIEIKDGQNTSLGTIQLKRQSGLLDITSDPAGLTFEVRPAGVLFVNPGDIRTGETPAKLTGIPVGSYQVVIKRSGWPDYTTSVNLERNASATVKGQFVTGSVTISSFPIGATVQRDGKNLGSTPLTIDNVIPGDVSFVVTQRGMDPVTVSGRLEGGKTLALNATMQASDRVMKLSELDEKPMPVTQAEPELGSDLSAQGGSAFISFVVGTDGVPSDIKVEQASSPAVGRACLIAVAKWRFKPGMIAGKPVRSRVTLPFKIAGQN